MKDKVGTRSSSHRVGCAFFSGEFQIEAMPVDMLCLLCYDTRRALISFSCSSKTVFSRVLERINNSCVLVKILYSLAT